MSKSRFAILAVAVTTAVLAFATSTASAATSGAHFFSATGAVADNGALVVTFDEAGVAQQTVNLSLSATGNATYACLNGGGNHPKAANKETVTGPFGGSGTFAPTKNGRVSGSLSAGPPASNLTCPSGQTFVLACVTYTNIVLTDNTNGISTTIPDVTRTFFNIGAPC
jgi:hypothetical protein